MASGAAAAPCSQRAASAFRSAGSGLAFSRWPSLSAASASAPACASASKPARSWSSLIGGKLPWVGTAARMRLELFPLCVSLFAGVFARDFSVVAAEVRLGALLPGGDDPPPDFPGARELVEQLLALAPADGAAHRLQVLGEAA